VLHFIHRPLRLQFAATKVGAIVAGQTSVKAPEREAFEDYLPPDVHIVSCHSLHGPSVSPFGQPLVLIHHRGPTAALTLVESILKPFRSRFVYMTFEDHDNITANTQAVTHAAFLSMGSAWHSDCEYPWEVPQGRYTGGIETVKVNITHRIYANKWHVYAGLAILNPSAKVQIEQYAKSVTELFKLMLDKNESGLRKRVHNAREKVFLQNASVNVRPILLSEDFLDKFSLGTPGDRTGSPSTTSGPDNVETTTALTSPSQASKSNSHLSLLAMADCWASLSINPFQHLTVAATPIFRMWIGVAEYLFRDVDRLNAALDAALWDSRYRSNDMEFVLAARGWYECVQFGSFDLYRRRFESTAQFFSPRFAEAQVLSAKMIDAILEEAEGG
jgi:prephenate dehydrogenase (NADP+)